MSERVLEGDCIEMMQSLPAESVHCCVTSPPYWGLRDYGVDGQGGLEETFAEHLAWIVEVFEGVKRILHPSGTLWLNYGDGYATSPAGNSAETMSVKQKSNNGSLAKWGGRAGTGHDLKPKDLIGMPWAVAFALRDAGWWLRSDIIWAKCLSGGTRLYAKTQKGEMPSTLKDLARLDPTTVQLWDGEKWNQVIAWDRQPRPEHPIAIVLRNGERIGCTAEHRWPTERGLVRADELQPGDVLMSCTLPGPGERAPLHITDEVGWFAGAFLADGSFGKGGTVLQFASHASEQERFDRIAAIAESYGGTCRVHQTSENGATCNVYGPVLCAIVRQYIAGRNAHGKHLHPRCWGMGNGFLGSLLAGYLQGDGHLRCEGREWRLGFCRNDALAADLRCLGARLGASVRLRRAVHTMGEREFPGWRGTLRFGERRTADTAIVDIRRSRARVFWDVQLAEEPHTFALASGTLTHNSNPMPESCRDRPTKAHEYLFLMSKRARYFWDQEAVREAGEGYGRGTLFRASHYENNRAFDNDGEKDGGANRHSFQGGRNIRTVWTIPTHAFPGSHFATFPPKLVEPCIKAGTSGKGCCPECLSPWERVVDVSGGTIGQGWHDHTDDMGRGHRTDGAVTGRASGYSRTTTGWQPTCTCDAGDPIPCTVFDPFTGSGTTGIVARSLKRNFIGTELNPEYAEMARRRIALPYSTKGKIEDVPMPLFEGGA